MLLVEVLLEPALLEVVEMEVLTQVKLEQQTQVEEAVGVDIFQGLVLVGQVVQV